MRWVPLAVAIALAAPSPASGYDFAWIGEIELAAEGLESGDPQTRLQAITQLGRFDIVHTRDYLLEALGDRDKRVRQSAARLLAREQIAEAAPAVIEWLNDPDSQVRQMAADTLGDLGTDAAVTALIRSLGDLDSLVRLRAVVALGQVGSAEVVVPLIGRLDDDKADVRKAAVEQLQAIGDRRAVIPLVGAFDDASLEVRKAAIAAVGKLGDDSAVHALARLVRDQVEEIRIAAVGALGDLQAVAETDELIGNLDHGSSQFRARVAYALGQIARHPEAGAAGERAVRALVQALADPRLRAAAREALLAAGAAAVPALAAHLDGELEGDPATAVVLLREIGDRRATPALVAELERGRLSQELVLEALGSTGDERALVPILGLLSADDAAVRLQAMTALRPLLAGEHRAGDVLAGMLDDPDLEIRVLAAEYLGLMQAARAVEPLLELAAGADEPRLRAAAIEALGEIADPRATGVLVDILREGPPALHHSATTALIYIGDTGSIEPLLAIARDPAAGARGHVVRALGGVLRGREHPGARRALESIARAEALTVSLAAIAALGAMSGTDAVPALLDLARDGGAARRRAAIAALGNLGDRRATEVLIEALGSPDDRIASAAAWALAKLGDPTALPTLERATERRSWAAPINAAAALAVAGTAEQAEPLARLLHHRNRLVRGNAAHGLGRLGVESARPALVEALAGDPSWLVRREAARALSRLGGADEALAAAAERDASEAVRAAAAGGRFDPPARTDWRNWYVVDPERGDSPVRQEPYFVVSPDGIVVAYYTDARGEVTEERQPPGDELVAPRGHERQH
jgi:HEAT repeat protein